MKREIKYSKKSDAIYEAIKDSKVGDQIVIHNPDNSVSLILKVLVKEREDLEKEEKLWCLKGDDTPFKLKINGQYRKPKNAKRYKRERRVSR